MTAIEKRKTGENRRLKRERGGGGERRTDRDRDRPPKTNINED